MTRSGTILLPIAGRSSRFPGMRPKWMLAAPTGELMLQLSLQTVPDWRAHRIVLGGLEDHLQRLNGLVAIRRSFGFLPDVVSFSQPTRGPAETVAEIIRRADVSGPIFVKDCDSWFEPQGEIFDDAICVGDLRELPRVRNVAAKSFVHLDDEGRVTGITEKSVSSNYISVGGYGFKDAEAFRGAYERVVADPARAEPFVSHVVNEAMRAGARFRGVLGRDYHDVGTLEAWNAFRRERRSYLVDVDGVVFRNAGAFLPPFWDDPDVPLPRNVEALKRLTQRGAQLIFVTARPERHRAKTEAALRALGLRWHAMVCGVHHSGRVLINDFAPTNPFPSAVALNVVRDDDDLERLLESEE